MLHYKPCKDWAIDCFHGNTIFPYEAETGKELCEYYTPTADVVPKREVAREIIDELIVALQGEVDAEDKLDSSAWDESDMIGHYMHQYAVEKLEILVIA